MSGGSKSGGDTTSRVILPDYIDAQAQADLAGANEVASRAYEANPMKGLVGFTPEQNAAYAGLESGVGATNPYFDESASHVQRLLGSATPITTEQLNADTRSLLNPYSELVVDPSLALMREELNKSLNTERSRAVQSGAFGGSRLGVMEGTAQAEEALRAGQLRGGLLTQGYEAAAGRAAGMADRNLQAGLTAAQLFPQLGVQKQDQNRKDLATLEYIGRTQQQQQQTEQDVLATNWQEARDYPLYVQQLRQQALQATPYGSTQISTAPQQTRNVAGGVLGGAASGAAMGATLTAGNPYGVAIGAVGGGLLGAFG